MTALILTHMSGSEDGRTDVIDVGGSNGVATIGRVAGCSICIPDDPEASRQHAKLSYCDGAWWLEDLGSANGTFVGEFAQSRKISTAAKILPGQIFRIGLTRFKLEEDDFQVGNLKMTAQLVARVA
jgi:pSer/pThr/pTyr-binding forkhead associated (FHA) protein